MALLKYFFIFVFLSSLTVAFADDNYHCGIGSVTKFLSKVFTTGCDRNTLSSSCCMPHDDCIGNAWNSLYRVERNAAVEECDKTFKDCIWRTFHSEGPYCRAITYVTHGKVTQYYNQMCAMLGNVFC